MAEPIFWKQKNHPIGLALLPISWIYGTLEALNRKLTQTQHPGKPVVCVGNLTAGGGGKTPSVQWLCNSLREDGLNPAILSRGYGGQLKGPLKAEPSRHNAAQIGDEPLMLAADWPVYISADRMASLRMAVAEGYDVLVKDDGFQNPAMAHHFNLIVVDGASGIGNGRLLPAGPLRQKLDVALPSLDALLVIGTPTHASVDLLMDMVEALGKPVFHGQITSQQKPAKNGNKVDAFCGIAKPEKFVASLETAGFEIDHLHSFPDHHMFTDAQAEKLLASDADLITTQKDMARLMGAHDGSARARLAAKAAAFEIALEVENADALRQTIRDAMTAKQANQLYKSY